MCFVFKKVEFRVMWFCESKYPISKLEHFLQICLKRSWLGTPGSERVDRSHFSSRPPAWALPKALLKHPEASVLQRHPPHLAVSSFNSLGLALLQMEIVPRQVGSEIHQFSQCCHVAIAGGPIRALHFFHFPLLRGSFILRLRVV